jgi:hypothetical protein
MKDDSSPQSPLMAALEKFEAAESNFLKLERLWSEIEGLKSQFLVRIAYDQDEKSRKKFDEGLKELQTHAVWRSQSDRLQLAPRRLESGKCLFSTLRCVRHIKRRVAWRRSSWDTGNDKDKPVKVLASSQKGGLLHIHLGVGASHDNGSFRRKRNLLNLFQAGSNRSSCHLRSTVLTCPNVNNLYVRAVLFVEGRLGNLPFRVLRELAPQLEMHRHFARCLPASAAWAQAEQSPRASSSVLRRASKTDSSIARPKASIIFVNFSASSA